MKQTATLTLSLLLLTPLGSLADVENTDDPPPYTGGRSGGSRGCSMSEISSTPNIPALILLAPTPSDSQTVSTRPAFAWFVRDGGSWPMEFRLYEHDSTAGEMKLVTEIKDEHFKSSPGIMMLSLSEWASPLSVGRKYLWQVELVCDANRPSGNPYAEAEIEVVDLSPALDTALARADAEVEQATLYEGEDFWYDALATVLMAHNNPQVAQLKSSLLDGLAEGADESARLRESSIHYLQP